MTPELQQRIDKEAEAAYPEGLQLGRNSWHVGYQAGATAWGERAEDLERWKAEASQLLEPIFEYGRRHPDTKLGTNYIEFVLNRAKAYDALLEHAEKLKKALEDIRDNNTHWGASERAKTAIEEYEKSISGVDQLSGTDQVEGKPN